MGRRSPIANTCPAEWAPAVTHDQRRFLLGQDLAVPDGARVVLTTKGVQVFTRDPLHRVMVEQPIDAERLELACASWDAGCPIRRVVRCQAPAAPVRVDLAVPVLETLYYGAGLLRRRVSPLLLARDLLAKGRRGAVVTIYTHLLELPALESQAEQLSAQDVRLVRVLS